MEPGIIKSLDGELMYYDEAEKLWNRVEDYCRNDVIATEECYKSIEKLFHNAGKQVVLNNISRIYASPEAIVVIFEDNSKEIVRLGDGDTYDLYAGVAQAVCKHIYGSNSAFHKLVDRKIVKSKAHKKKKNNTSEAEEFEDDQCGIYGVKKGAIALSKAINDALNE